MRRYETTVIVHPSISQEERQAFFDKVTELISGGNGLLIRFEEWGQRRLAYEIRKETRGYYGFFEFSGDGSLVKELERNIRLDDRSLKYMTICTDPDVDKEAILAEIEAARSEAAKAEAAKAEAEEQEDVPPAVAPVQMDAEAAPGASDTIESSEKEATPDDSI